MTPFHPVSRRSGVTDNVMQRNRSVQIPVSLVTSLSGFALRWPVSAAQSSHAAGIRLARHTAAFRSRPPRITFRGTDPHSLSLGRAATAPRATSVVLLQVHAGVPARNLSAVTVEHQRFSLEELADAALGRLAPPWMVDVRIHVRVEAVLVGGLILPRVEGLLLDEADHHDPLDALEPVPPRDDETERRAVLIGQHFAVQTHTEDR